MAENETRTARRVPSAEPARDARGGPAPKTAQTSPGAAPRRKRRKLRRTLRQIFRTAAIVLLALLGLVLLLGLSPLLVLLLLIPAHIRAKYEDGAFSGELRYAFLRVPLTGKKPPEAPETPASGEKAAKKSAEKASGTKKQPLSEQLGLVRALVEAGWVALKRLLRHLRVTELDVRVRAAAGDAADTALLYGRLYGIAGTVYSLLGANGRLGRFHFEAVPDFDGDKSVYNARAALSLRPFWLVSAAFAGGLKLLAALIRQKIAHTPPGSEVPGAKIPTTTTKGGKKMAHPIENLMGTSMQKIREMVDVNTMIGDPIHITDKITVIPISRASFGFASGGSDIPTKQDKEFFGGGAGAGVKIDPVAFIVVNGDDVQLLPYAPAPAPGADRAISMVPGLIDQISGLFKKNKKDAPEEAPAEEAAVVPAEDKAE